MPVVPPVIVSLPRALSKQGAASRSQAQTLILAGVVTVNGRPITNPHHRVDLNRDQLAVAGKLVQPIPYRYLALNKPKGLITTTQDEQGRDTVYRCLGEEANWLAPVGRLDKASEGLLLFTNDTRWAAQLLDPASHLPKVYHVQLDCQLEAVAWKPFLQGVSLGDGTTARIVSAEPLRTGMRRSWWEITLDQGLNRQIRRMAQILGADVVRLVRVAIGPIKLGELAKGQTRELTQQERLALVAH